jgi:quercetin dioxygenase-like cupin family protein
MALQKSVSKSRKSIKSMQRLPHLASSLLQVSLPEEVKQLRQQESWLRGTGRSSKTLVKYPDLRVVLISMKANTVMKEHKTEARITILTVAGHIRLHLADATIELPVGSLLALDGAVAHDVEALKQSVFLLTIAWHKKKHKS